MYSLKMYPHNVRDFNMLMGKSRSLSLCRRSIVRSSSYAARLVTVRSIQASAALVCAHDLIRSRRLLSLSVVYHCFRCLAVEQRTFSIMAAVDTSDPGLVLKLVAASVTIADRSGGIVRNIMSAGNLGIVEKGINDVQTEADRRVQHCILASLNKLFPDVAVIAEEEQDNQNMEPDWIETSMSREVLIQASMLPDAVRNATASQICVWVDPLDGTQEYTQGLLDHVTVLIGIAVDGEAVAGIIHQPYFNYENEESGTEVGRTIWGIVGLGCFGFERKLPNPAQRVVVTTRSHDTEAVRHCIEACEPTEVIRVGGAGHKVLLLIEGKAHAYIFASPGCLKWDTCAPEAVLHALGGTLTDVHGNQYQYHSSVQHQNTGGVLATSAGQSHSWYLSKVPDEIKASLPVD